MNNAPPLPPRSPLEDEPDSKTESETQSRLRSLTRMVIGSVEVGVEELFSQLQVWEEKASQQDVDPLDLDRLDSVDQDPSRAPASPWQPAGENGETYPELLRLALIGLIFETLDRVDESLSTLRRFERWANRLVSPMLGPILDSRALRPFSRRFQHWHERGDVEVARWIARGRVERARSRALAHAAFDETVDGYIEYLTTNPEVQELVQTQSTGLAAELIEEVRERTVSADTFLEGVARSMLHRKTRPSLHPPVAGDKRGSPARSSRRPVSGGQEE